MSTESSGVGGLPSNGRSESPRVSADGRFVAFQSAATNLVASGCTTGVAQVFRRDRQTGEVRCVSTTAAGVPGDQPSGVAAISSDGRFVAFQSAATNLVAACGTGTQQVFRRDLQTGTVECLSVGPGGTPGNGPSGAPAISADGSRVAFESTARNLDPACVTGVAQVFLRAAGAATPTCFSVDPTEQAGDGPSGQPALSGDGRFLAFTTTAPRLIPGSGGLSPVPGRAVAQVTDLPSQIVRRSTAVVNSVADLLSGSGGTPGNAPSRTPSLSFDGSMAAFESGASNLTATSPGGVSQVLVSDVVQGILRSVSTALDGSAGNGASRDPVISGNGLVVAFASLATNLVAGSLPPDLAQIFRRALDVLSAPIQLLSQVDGTPGNGGSRAPTLSQDGGVAIFQSAATNLASGDTNGADDLFANELSVRVRITAPANGTRFALTAPTEIRITWTELSGITQYGLEFTGANQAFTNPNGSGPDSVNGFGGTGGGVLVSGTSFSAVLDPAFPPGNRQVRVIGLSASGEPVGTFTDAVTLILGAGAIPPDARPTITVPVSGSVLTSGGAATFTWTVVPGVAQFLFEVTGPGRQFANPNGSQPDPGALGRAVVSGTTLPVTVPPGTPAGVYQVRVISLTAAGTPVGTFSDAVAVNVQPGPVPAASPVPVTRQTLPGSPVGTFSDAVTFVVQ